MNNLHSSPENCIVLMRLGNFERFDWFHSEHPMTFDAAYKQRNELTAEGYRCVIVSLHEFECVGTPKTFEADEYFDVAKLAD